MRNACVTAQSAPSNSDRFSAHFSRSEVNTVRYWVRVKAGLAWPSCLLTASTGTPRRKASVGVCGRPWPGSSRTLSDMQLRVMSRFRLPGSRALPNEFTNTRPLSPQGRLRW